MFSASCGCPEAAPLGGITGETGGIPKPGGTVNPGPAAPPVAGGEGLGELAAKTLPMLRIQGRNRGGSKRESKTREKVTKVYIPFSINEV